MVEGECGRLDRIFPSSLFKRRGTSRFAPGRAWLISGGGAATPFLEDADGGGEGEGRWFSFADEIFSDVRFGEV